MNSLFEILSLFWISCFQHSITNVVTIWFLCHHMQRKVLSSIFLCCFFSVLLACLFIHQPAGSVSNALCLSSIRVKEQIVRTDVGIVVDVNRVTKIIERRQRVKWYVNCINKSTQMNSKKSAGYFATVLTNYNVVFIGLCACMCVQTTVLIYCTPNHSGESNF